MVEEKSRSKESKPDQHISNSIWEENKRNIDAKSSSLEENKKIERNNSHSTISQKSKREETKVQKIDKIEELRKSDLESRDSKPQQLKVLGFMDNLESSFNEESEEDR